MAEPFIPQRKKLNDGSVLVMPPPQPIATDQLNLNQIPSNDDLTHAGGQTQGQEYQYHTVDQYGNITLRADLEGQGQPPPEEDDGTA